MSTPAHRSDVISKTRQAATELLTAYDKLISLKNEWDNGVKLQIVDASGADPAADGYKAGDFAGTNQGLMKADINQVLGTAMVALTAFVVSADGKKLQDIRT
jgi:hypothetical protein